MCPIKKRNSNQRKNTILLLLNNIIRCISSNFRYFHIMLAVIASASIYFFYMRTAFTKCLPVGICAYRAYQSGILSKQEVVKDKVQPSYPFGIFYGLCFSMVGDALLFYDDMLPKPKEPGMGDSNYFKMGLVAFLIAHVQYIRVFYLHSANVNHSIKLFIPYAILFSVLM